MRYTVIQVDNAAVTEAQLAAALPVTKRFSPADAAKVARESFGLFVDRLDLDRAKTFQAALKKQGIAASIIRDSELFPMPPLKVTKRIDCLPEHLLVYDAFGRARTVGWSEVLVVAAGWVSLYETHTVEKKHRLRSKSPAEAMGDVVAMVFPALSEFHNDASTITTRTTHGREVPRLVLDILLLTEPSRYRAEAQELSYAYLGDRQKGDPASNFVVMLGDLMKHATSAVYNQGAVALISDSQNVFVYPSRKSFEREIVWLVWHGQQSHGSKSP